MAEVREGPGRQEGLSNPATRQPETESRCNMDITELTAKLPDKFKPWATTYGPAFLTMTAAEIQAIIIRIASGDIVAATRAVLAKLPSDEAALQAGRDLEATWQKNNELNAARIELVNRALVALGEVLLAIALALVGL